MNYSDFKACMRKEAGPWGTRAGKPVKGTRQKAREREAEQQRIAAEDAAAKAAEEQRMERNGQARRQAEDKAYEENMRKASEDFRRRYGMEMPGWYMGYMSDRYGNGMPAGFNPYDVWSHPQLTADDYNSYISSSRASYDRMLAEGRLTAGQHSMLSGQLDGMVQGMPEVEARLSKAMQPWQRPAEVVRPTPGSTVANLRERQKYNSGYTALQQFSAADPLSAAVAAPFIMAAQPVTYVAGDAVSHLAPEQQRKALEYSRANGNSYLGYNPHRSILWNGLAAGGDFLGNTALGLYDVFFRGMAGKVGANKLNGFMTNLRNAYNENNIRALGDFTAQAVRDGKVSPGTAGVTMDLYGNPYVRDTAANVMAAYLGLNGLKGGIAMLRKPYMVNLPQLLGKAAPFVDKVTGTGFGTSVANGVGSYAAAVKPAMNVAKNVSVYGGALASANKGNPVGAVAGALNGVAAKVRGCFDPSYMASSKLQETKGKGKGFGILNFAPAKGVPANSSKASGEYMLFTNPYKFVSDLIPDTYSGNSTGQPKQPAPAGGKAPSQPLSVLPGPSQDYTPWSSWQYVNPK